MDADRWLKIIEAIEPEIVKLTKVMNYDIEVDISIIDDCTRPFHIVKISESHDMRDWAWALPRLEDSISWAREQLATWPECSQLEHNSWGFTTRTDAEKFKILFLLKWGR